METATTRDELLASLQLAFFMDGFAEISSALICVAGALANFTLILLILNCTPNTMKSYSVFLFNFAFFDLCTCILSLFACQKTVFSGIALIYIFHGPCKYISAWFCYFCHCFVCHSLAHSQWILLASFIYRYFILIGTFPTIRTMIAISIALYSMSHFILVTYVMDIGDSDEFMRIITHLHPQYHYDDESIWGKLVLSGNLSIFQPFTMWAIVYMTTPCVPIYALILYYRHRTLAILNDSSVNISDAAKSSHRKLIQALTIQAMIPIFWLMGSAIFTMAEFGVISGPIFENIIFRLMDCIPSTSPFISIIFIGPYRAYARVEDRNEV
ncbi:unnamed protein product [Caenorhabditis bovis]|uniref:G-protein coupled receptors family 1 profile domain-containing protein n=1 Tax=Caenorhabditis bovis TaxID=2654633 RepID=A0A8S1EV15_9PELO|nr:unnamed protein product [Caenorhabditis bovis]